METRKVRGTHDIFGSEIKNFNLIKDIVSQNATISAFKELQTPIFEFTKLFSKPLGEQSDVVLKEMYTFRDKNEEFLTLRPEYTTPMIRAAITNNLLNELPLKVFGIGPMFRRERPQKGRYRQFNQINFEIFGSNDYLADIELILIAHDILKSLLPNIKIDLHLNSLGTKENLSKYKIELSKFFDEKKMKLTEESRKKIISNPLRILDSKDDQDIEVSSQAPVINDFISSQSKDHYNEIKKNLNTLNLNFKENPNLVRGLDYYCNTVFEFKTSSLGSQDTLLGGGRYDGLIGILGGPDIPGIGWAAGVERISMLMNKSNDIKTDVHLAIFDSKFKDHLIKVTKYLRDNKIKFYWNYKYNFKKSLSKASSENAKYIIIIGESEFRNNFYTLKNLDNGEQFEIKMSEIEKFILNK